MAKAKSKMEVLREKFLQWVEDYADRKITSDKEIDRAFKFLNLDLRNRHMEQIKIQGDKSLALRLIKFLPKDGKVREKYIELTNPEIKPLLLLNKPKKI